jgi:predicted Fe-Mo cluster-binding NifX family protein
MNTTVAIPVWEGQVSTTFDFARKLLVVEVDRGRELSRKEVLLRDEPVRGKARTLQDQAVQIVLCGAVSQPLAQAISQIGIQIIPYVSGPVDRVLAGYLCGRLAEPCFLQPGCRPAARRRWRHQGGCCGNEANRGNEPQITQISKET